MDIVRKRVIYPNIPDNHRPQNSSIVGSCVGYFGPHFDKGATSLMGRWPSIRGVRSVQTKEIVRNMRYLALLALACSLACGQGVAAKGTKKAEGLRSNEYAAVGAIYDNELSALGKRALYPICITLPAGISSTPVLKFLQSYGYAVSEPSLCEPAMAQSGTKRPKDYTHGMRIYLNDPERDSDGSIRIKVEVSDLTVRPGEDIAALLRDGVYQLKLDDKGQWQIVGYAKKYDSADNKQSDCTNPQPATPPNK